MTEPQQQRMHAAMSTDFELLKQHIKKNCVPQAGELLHAYYSYKEKFYDYSKELDDTKEESRQEIAEKEAEIERLKEVLRESKSQIEYLHQKFSETGTGNAVLAKIKSIL